jgi:hypothetical protein
MGNRTLFLRPLTATLALCLVAGVFSGCAIRIPLTPIGADRGETDLAIVDKYMDATRLQQQAMRGAQMEVDIDARLPKLEKQGKLRALRSISRLGQITYKALGFTGDNTVKQEVITRYLSAEAEARDTGTIAITPANYRFRYSGRIVQGGRTMQIVEVTPRRKAVGLFKGEIWIDDETGMPLRESGQFVKTPSVFLKKIAFVRDYQMEDGVAIPKHIESTVETRIVGKAELQISFSHFTKPDGGEVQAPSASQPGGDQLSAGPAE